ncbi:MAG: EF-P beta-lysylation protein EpmB [Pseudomonadota bacterium]|jgi:EF-P beta-lysylation protein EpmB
MITATPAAAHSIPWQRQWREAISDPNELLAALDLAPSRPAVADDALRPFPMRVPRAFLARMRRGDPLDPLLRQVLPLAEEDHVVEGYGVDAVGDLASRAAPGVLHKYSGRALLVATGSCAVHCRYCFRRHFPYADEGAATDRWHGALAWLAAHPEVEEVLLSGGDPWSLSDGRLNELSDGLRRLPHVRRLRVHTRLPVVLPDRVDAGLLRWIEELHVPLVVVLHANHPNELDAGTARAFAALRAAGATLLNQSVLLRGVNDDAAALVALSEGLFAQGALPYYLHQLDRVAGAAHFAVDDAAALTLQAALRRSLPGYLVPRLVRETAGAPYKVPL